MARGDGLYRRKKSDGSPGAWVWDARVDGQRVVRIFDGALTRTQAGNLATIERRNVLLGASGIRKKKDLPFDEAADLFLEHARSNPKRHTVRYHEQCVKELRKGFTGKNLGQVTAFSIEGYRRKRSAKVRCNRELAVLRRLFNLMILWGKFAGPNPTEGVKLDTEPKRRDRTLDTDEENRLLEAAREPLRTALVLGLYAGLRIEAEALTLRWGAVDLRRGTLSVDCAYSKTHRARTLPLHPKAADALKGIRDRTAHTAPEDPVFVGRRGHPLRSIRTVFEKARKEAGLGKAVGLHTMRHTFTSRLVEEGVDLRTVQELGGWASLRMLERYAHLSPGHLRRAVNLLGTTQENPNEIPNTKKGASGK